MESGYRRTRRHRAACLASTLASALSWALICALLSGCFGIPEEPDVAVYVNDEAILESDVTEYIEGFREKNADYETDSGWASFLNESGYTAETMRRYVLDEYFIPQRLIEQECEKRSITVTDDVLDEVISEEKAYYEQRYGDGTWDSVLASYGYDEASWRENEANRLLEQQLMDSVIGEVEVTQDEIQNEADESSSNYNGKHSYYIAFESEELAEEALATLAVSDAAEIVDVQSDASDDDSSEQPVSTTLDAFAALGRAVDAGWNSLESDRDEMSAQYLQALNQLNTGYVSQPVEDDGAYLLVFCLETYTASSAEGHVVLSDIPARILEQITSDARDNKKESLFVQWLEELTTNSTIVYNVMPDGLPYDVNVAIDDGE